MRRDKASDDLKLAVTDGIDTVSFGRFFHWLLTSVVIMCALHKEQSYSNHREGCPACRDITGRSSHL